MTEITSTAPAATPSTVPDPTVDTEPTTETADSADNVPEGAVTPATPIQIPADPDADEHKVPSNPLA
jgi:hypothetical protein